MSSLYDNLFGPLDSDFCFIFFVLMLISFFYLVLTILAMVGYVFAAKKKDKKIVGALTSNALMLAIAYFTHRTLYSMCISSLR